MQQVQHLPLVVARFCWDAGGAKTISRKRKVVHLYSIRRGTLALSEYLIDGPGQKVHVFRGAFSAKVESALLT